MAERAEDERQRHLLGAALDEQRRPREEELAPLGVQLAERAEARRGRQRLGMDDRRALRRAPLHERELVEPADVEERGRVGRVEHLVPAPRRTSAAAGGGSAATAAAGRARAPRSAARGRARRARRAPSTAATSAAAGAAEDERGRRRPGTALRPARRRGRPSAPTPAGTRPAAPARAARPGRAGSSRATISSPSASVALSRIAVAVRRGQVAGRRVRRVVRGAASRRAASTFDLPTLGPPTSAHTGPGEKPTERAERKPADPHLAHSEPGPFHARSLCPSPRGRGRALHVAGGRRPDAYVRRRDRYATAVVRPSSANPSTNTQIGATETVAAEGRAAAAT